MRNSRSDGLAFDFRKASRDEAADFLAEVALQAGPAVMDVYERTIQVFAKDDGSPVTLADQRAESVICGRLAEAAAPLPVVAEEAAASGAHLQVEKHFLLVDPLDGTKEFIARNGEFTINVALIEKGKPVAGAVYAPAIGRLWVGGSHAYVCDVAVGAQLPPASSRRPIRTRTAPPAGLVALASRSHGDQQTEAFLARLPIIDRRSKGSSLKFCEVAEGLADVYPRFGPTMEWDTAAGDAVLRAAGGTVVDLIGQPLPYGKTDMSFRNGPFVAWGDANAAARFGNR